MKDITLELIKNILAVDDTVSKDKADDILFACTQVRTEALKCRHLINAKESMKIIGVSRPTLNGYRKKGFITQVVLSPRKIRFDEENVRHFAEKGIQGTETDFCSVDNTL